MRKEYFENAEKLEKHRSSDFLFSYEKPQYDESKSGGMIGTMAIAPSIKYAFFIILK